MFFVKKLPNDQKSRPTFFSWLKFRPNNWAISSRKRSPKAKKFGQLAKFCPI
jgi:hypothetical protein